MDASSWYLRRFARRAIEAYPSIRRMASSITGRRRMGSPATVNSYIPGVMKFVDFVGYDNPEDALAAIKSGEVNVEDSLNRQDSGFIDTMLDRYANKTVNTYVFGVKKWLEANGVKVDLSKVEMPTTTVTRNKDRAPTQEELRKLLHYCTQLKDRVVIHILTSSGLRIGTLLSLKWGDVDFNYPDVARITVRRAPGRKFSRRSSKSGDSNLYVTWITPEAKELLLEYKRYREQKGETITPESPLIEDGAGGHMTVSSYERRWHRILEKAGLNERTGNTGWGTRAATSTKATSRPRSRCTSPSTGKPSHTSASTPPRPRRRSAGRGPSSTSQGSRDGPTNESKSSPRSCRGPGQWTRQPRNSVVL